MASDDTTEILRKALAKAMSSRSENDPWQEHFGRETTAQAVKSVQATDIIQGLSGSWAASYAFDWGAGISPRNTEESRQDLQVPTPIREKLTKLGQPGYSDVDFVPYNWNTNRFANKGPTLIGHQIAFEVVGPTLKSPACDWTWIVAQGAGFHGGDRLMMSTRTDGTSATCNSLAQGYNIPNFYDLGNNSLEDLLGGFYVVISSDGSNPGSIPAGTTPMGALPGQVDTARFEVFRVAGIRFVGPNGSPNGGIIELHPDKPLGDYFDLPDGSTRHIRAITILRPKVTQLVAVPGSGSGVGREQTFVVVPPRFASSPDNYPPYDGGTSLDGTWLQGGFDEDGTDLPGASNAYGGTSRLPIPLAIRQGQGIVEKSPGVPTTPIGNFLIQSIQNGSANDVGRIMRIYHVDSDDGDSIDHGTVNQTLGWYEIVAVDPLVTTYTLKRVAEVDPLDGVPFFGPGPFQMEPGDPDIKVFFTIHDPVEALHLSSSFDIDNVQASRIDCLINPRDVERTTKQVSDPSDFPLPFGSSPARADRAIFNTKKGVASFPAIPDAENPGSLLDLGFRMVLFPARYEGGTAFPDFDNPIYSRELVLDPSITDEKQFWEADYSAGVVRLSHPPVAGGGDVAPNGTNPAINNPRGHLVLFAACVPYSREACQKGTGIRIAARRDEDVDLFSARSHSVIDVTNTPALGGTAPFFNDEVVLTDVLDIPETGYFDVLNGDTLFYRSFGTWSYQSTRVQNFGGGDVTVLEGVYCDPNATSPTIPPFQGDPDPSVVIRRETFFGQESDDNSDVIDDHRFDTVYGSAHRACTVRFVGATCTLQIDGSVVVDASGVDVQDEGTLVVDNAKTLNFIGDGVTASIDASDPTIANIVIPGAEVGVEVRDEGTPVATPASFLNFIGPNVVASTSGSGADITVNPAVDVQDESALIQAASTFLNFLGSGVTATVNGSGVDVTIPGGIAQQDWELIDGLTTVNPSSTTITFSSLDGDTDGIYCVIGRVASNGGFASVTLRPNGLSNFMASYDIQLHPEPAGAFSQRGNTPGMHLCQMGDIIPEGGSLPGGSFFIYFMFPATPGSSDLVNMRLGLGTYISIDGFDGLEEGTEGFLDIFGLKGGLWQFVSTNITSFDVTILGTGVTYEVGSTVCLYRIRCNETEGVIPNSASESGGPPPGPPG